MYFYTLNSIENEITSRFVHLVDFSNYAIDLNAVFTNSDSRRFLCRYNKMSPDSEI